MQRYPERLEGKSAFVVSRGLACVVVGDRDCPDRITRQTQGALIEMERLLSRAGSSKDSIVQTTVDFSDTADRSVMDAARLPWIGEPDNWPHCACFGVGLDPGYLIEIVATAETL